MFNRSKIRKFISLCLGIFTASSLLLYWDESNNLNNKQYVIKCDKLNLTHKFYHTFVYNIQNWWKLLNQYLLYQHSNKPNKNANRLNNLNDTECKSIDWLKFKYLQLN